MIDPSTFSPPIALGDAPLSKAQIARKLEAALNRIVSRLDRENLITTQYTVAEQIGMAGAQVEAATININAFNQSLAAYRKAQGRFVRYALADGRDAIYEDQETGFDETTMEPIIESVEVSPAIEPLDETVEIDTFDPETGEPTGTETISNPVITRDEIERAEAAAVIFNADQAVIDFAAAG